jgi:hypothetical protein
VPIELRHDLRQRRGDEFEPSLLPGQRPLDLGRQYLRHRDWTEFFTWYRAKADHCALTGCQQRNFRRTWRGGARRNQTLVARLCGIDLFSRYKESFKRMFNAPLALATPLLTLPAFDDRRYSLSNKCQDLSECAGIDQ